MGKASRAKRNGHQAMAKGSVWQQAASRQNKARRRKEIESHNAMLDKLGAMDLVDDAAGVCLIVDGVKFVGKQAVFEVYTSWVRNEIKKDDATHLLQIAELGAPLLTSIWDVEVEVIPLGEPGTKLLFDPLKASFSIGKNDCFNWLADHAFESKAGTLIALNLFCEVTPLVDGFDQKSDQFIFAKVLGQKVFKKWLYMGEEKIIEKLRQFSECSSVMTELFKHLEAERESGVQREAIELSLVQSGGSCEVEPDLEAIKAAQEAVEDAKHSSSPAVSGRGRARAL
jgi:hypothetical protein